MGKTRESANLVSEYNIFVDISNDRVGLGTTVPTAKLDVLGDVKIRPSLDNVFISNQPLGLYFQAYNSALDQSSLTPSLRVTFRITQNGETVLELVDDSEESVQFFSSRRMVFIQELPVVGLLRKVRKSGRTPLLLESRC